MKRVSFLLLLTLLCQLAGATTYYVSMSDGNDGNSVTNARNKATPWKTVAPLRTNQSNGTLLNGDSILFKCGDVWFDSLIVSKGLNLSSYGTGAKPVISGFVTVATWTALGGGIWESNALAVTGTAVNSVTINGKMYAMGRYPNADDANGGYLAYEKGTTTYLVDNVSRPAAVTNATWQNAWVVSRISHYVVERSAISSISTDTIKVSPSFFSAPTAGFGYFLENDINALDQFGEWYFNPSTKKIDVYFGASVPTGVNVQVSARSVLITPTASNTTISNIVFTGANTYGIWSWLTGLSNLAVNNCEFYFSGIDAMSMEGRANIVFTNNITDWSNGNGLCMANKDKAPYVAGNLFNHSGTFPGMLQRSQFSSNRYGIGICHIPSEGYTGMVCRDNIVLNSGGHGILFYGDTQYIYHNIVDTFCLVMDDDGGIYTANQAMVVRKNVLILNNIVRNASGKSSFGTTGSANPPVGIYLDDGTNNVNVIGNTVYNGLTGYGIFLHNARKSTIRGNLAYNNSTQLVFGHGTQVSMVIDSNIVAANQFFSRSGQKVRYLFKDQSFTESFASYTIKCDSNSYCSPFSSEANSIQTNWFNHITTNYDLAGWRTATGFDAATTPTPVAVSDPNAVILKVAESSPVNIRTCYDLVKPDGTHLVSGEGISAFGSMLLIRQP